MLKRYLVGVALAVALAAGCGETSSSEGGGLDPTPERQDGSESLEFEPEDLDVAENAGRLVELYCDGAGSEARVVGCLSHVTEGDVCTEDTAGKQAALAEYRDETGDDLICE